MSASFKDSSYRLLTGALLLACCACQAAGSSADAGGAEPDSCPSSFPICSAFLNDGKFGGSVKVSVDAEAKVAIVTTNNLASHAMGPYGGNPNQALPQKFRFSIPLNATPGPTPAGFGHVAVAFNGVSLFNPADARDIGGCTGNAAYLESDQVDAFGGHPTPGSEYHYHTGDFLKKATELGLKNASSKHSSLVGYAFDGLPIYGPYGFADGKTAAGGIRALRSCYRLKSTRTCCIDPTRCLETSTFENKITTLGAFVEDFEFDGQALAAGQCDLDEFNSRVSVTPEYPTGIRTYVMTFDAQGHVAFPFIFGTRYWGTALVNRGPPPPRP